MMCQMPSLVKEPKIKQGNDQWHIMPSNYGFNTNGTWCQALDTTLLENMCKPLILSWYNYSEFTIGLVV
jgi:hypothetical protein